MTFELARKVADAVLFEGYVLYPYRASSAKNQVRWQFGVLAPRAWSEAGGSDPWCSQTECLVDTGGRDDQADLWIKVRFLQVQSKVVERVEPGRAVSAAEIRRDEAFRPVPMLEVDDAIVASFDEGVEREVDVTVAIGRAAAGERAVPFDLAAALRVEPLTTEAGGLAGRVVRRQRRLSGTVRVRSEPLPGPFGAIKVRIRVENLTAWARAGAGREDALRRSLVATHTLLAVTPGRFVSLLDPPEWARPAVAGCDNVNTWPVLAGEDGRDDVLLSSPIILYDHPAIAPESPGDLFDATEIDEILTLRTMTLTDEEKREARGTDERAAEIIDRVDTMPPEILERLHGAVRYLRDVTGGDQGDDANAPPGPALRVGDRPAPSGQGTGAVPWWDPGADESVSPGTDQVRVGDVEVSKGSRVRLRPGRRRADAQDMFLAGWSATVEGVFFDVDGATWLAVTLDDDPAADLHQWHGRFLYFSPEEVEPLAPPGAPGAEAPHNRVEPGGRP
jgi:hypothetical protein